MLNECEQMGGGRVAQCIVVGTQAGAWLGVPPMVPQVVRHGLARAWALVKADQCVSA